MSHQVLWTDKLTEEFIKRAALSNDEAYIMRTRARGHTATQQAMELGLSESTIARMIAKLKIKYDAVQSIQICFLFGRFRRLNNLWMRTKRKRVSRLDALYFFAFFEK